jgi:hypothetical protein
MATWLCKGGTVNKTLLLLVVLLTTSCVSVLIRPTPQVPLSEQSIELGDVSIDGCEPYDATEYELTCEAKSQALVYALQDTRLFTNVSLNNLKTKYSITLKPYVSKPYYFSLGTRLLSFCSPQ